jgi:hypothetical protein
MSATDICGCNSFREFELLIKGGTITQVYKCHCTQMVYSRLLIIHVHLTTGHLEPLQY